MTEHGPTIVAIGLAIAAVVAVVSAIKADTYKDALRSAIGLALVMVVLTVTADPDSLVSSSGDMLRRYDFSSKAASAIGKAAGFALLFATISTVAYFAALLTRKLAKRLTRSRST